VKFENKRKNHLKSKIIIDQLFSTGNAITIPPFRLVFLEVENSDFAGVQTLVSVPKRRFKLAVTRNLIKRKISEAYRLNATGFQLKTSEKNQHIAIGFIYIGRKDLDLEHAQVKMKEILEKLSLKLKN
jgi:ribonuclease P protein component